MNYADIKCNDAANGPGVRISLFVSGCTHHCKGCFNEVTWDFNYGNPFTQKEIDMIIKDLEPPYISGLTILGGEPMEPANQPGILPLIRKVREVYGSGKTIWIYSGYLFDRDILGRMVNEIPETKEILSGIDVLMDGPYVEELKDLIRDLKFDRLSGFTYSREEDTKAYFMKPQIPEKVKVQRLKEIMDIQKEISLEHNRLKVGNKYSVIVENITDDEKYFVCRSYMEAPDVDGRIYVKIDDASSKKAIIGEYSDAKIIYYNEYDLFAEFI